ncbi:MAG: Multidrug export protein EmrB [Chlamydiia bacterium]|nr:Multidrug export protein EmrB [Chlamydiia bacterium]
MQENVSSLGENLTSSQKIVLSFALCLVAFMFVLDYTIANVAVPYIAGGLGVSTSQGTYVITFFSVGNAIFLPMTSWLVKMFGDAKVIIWAAILFTFFSFTCAAAPTLVTLVVARFLQGAAAGPLIPLSQGILTKLYREKVDLIATVFSLIVMVAPVIGPVVGGYICYNYLWRWIFYINIPIGVISVFLMALLMKDFKDETTKEGFDWVTFFLLFFGMTCLQLFLDKGQQWDWWLSYRVRVLSIIAFLSIAYILMWSFISEKPLFKLNLFKNRRFTISCFIIFFAYSLYFAAVVIFPLWLEDVLGYTSYLAGLAVAPMGIGSLTGAVIVGRLMTVVKRHVILIAAGFFWMALGCFYAANFVPMISFFHIAMSRVIFGFGLSFWMVPTISMVSNSLEDRDLAAGLGIFHFLRSLSGGIGTSIYTTLYIRRGIHQQTNFATTFNEYKEVSRAYFEDITRYIPDLTSAQNYLESLIESQTETFAFVELNNVMGYICLFLMIISLFGAKKESTTSI